MNLNLKDLLVCIQSWKYQLRATCLSLSKTVALKTLPTSCERVRMRGKGRVEGERQTTEYLSNRRNYWKDKEGNDEWQGNRGLGSSEKVTSNSSVKLRGRSSAWEFGKHTLQRQEEFYECPWRQAVWQGVHVYPCSNTYLCSFGFWWSRRKGGENERGRGIPGEGEGVTWALGQWWQLQTSCLIIKAECTACDTPYPMFCPKWVRSH